MIRTVMCKSLNDPLSRLWNSGAGDFRMISETHDGTLHLLVLELVITARIGISHGSNYDGADQQRCISARD